MLDAAGLVIAADTLLHLGATRFGVVKHNGVVHPYAACPAVTDGDETYPPARGAFDVASLREVVASTCNTCQRLVVANPSWLNSVLQPLVLAHEAVTLSRVQLEPMQSDVVGPNVMSPDVMSPDVMSPDVMNPDVMHAWGAFLRHCIHHPSGSITLEGIEQLLGYWTPVRTEVPMTLLGGRRNNVPREQVSKLANGAWHDPSGCSLVWGDALDGFAVLARDATTADVEAFAALWRCYEANGERRALEQVWELSRAVSRP